MNSLKSGFAFLFALFFVLGINTSIHAQAENPVSDDEVNEVARELYCPVCENIPLDVCPTQACALWRELIREKLALGWSSTQIEEFFAKQYGENVLSIPPRRGFNWLVYLLPPVILIGGLFVTVSLIQRAKQAEKTVGYDETRSSSPLSDDVLNQIENDLKKVN